MEADSIQWSTVYPIFGGKHHLALGGKPGVYRIRAFTAPGKPLAINRLGEVDLLGVLHIGKSKNLGRRIRTFRQAAEGLKAPHHAGREFSGWGFEKIIPRAMLHFDYFTTTSEEKALELERQLHEQYRRKFFDRPPLDSTSGQDRIVLETQ